MFAVSRPVEKSFEIWPGKLSFAAAGDGSREALDAAMDIARDLSRSVLEVAELLAKGVANALPRGRAGRIAVETVNLFRELIPSLEFPPVLAALPGAVCDAVLEGMLDAARRNGGVGFIAVSLGDVLALHQEPGVAAGVDGSVRPVLGEFVSALGAGIHGGAALGGNRSCVPTCGALDIVAVQSKSAAAAGLAAAIVTDAAADTIAVPRGATPRDRLFAMAWRERSVTASVGPVEPESIWQVLSASVRQATALRDKRLLRAVALGFKGRGRMVGPVDGDRLLRFGVPEWR
ncbi:MAG: hypothetical protein H5U13_03520 [Parvibaculum sp.]|nr:hypothetical protein [Parvibaculum sp.]